MKNSQIKYLRLLLFLSFILFPLSFSLLAQDFSANHPELQWKTIETEHFYVHYHQGTERTANVVAEIAEDIYPHITGLYDYEPDSKIDFVIRDTEDYANGGAYFYDNKIEIWSENLDYVLRGTHNWLQDVITHEFAHIISLQTALKTTRHIPAGWLQVFGYETERRPDVVRGFPDVLVSYPISTLVTPVWFAEGVAQFQTSNRRFDYRDSHREMILRDRVMTGNLLDFNEMSTFGKNSIGNESAYNQGFAFVNYMAETYGDTVVAKLARQASSLTTLSFKKVIKKVTGVGGDALHQQWHNHLKETYSQKLKTVLANEKIGRPYVDKGIGNMHPIVSPDGNKVAYLATGDADFLSQNALVVDDLSLAGKRTIAEFESAESGEASGDLKFREKQTVAARITGSLTWSPDSRYLAYSKIGLVDKTRSAYNDIYVYDLEENKEYRLTKHLRARHPDWSHDGSKLVFLIESDGLTNLYSLDLGNLQETLQQETWHQRFYHIGEHHIVENIDATPKKERKILFREVGYKGKELKQLTHLVNGRQIYHPRWSPDDSYIIFDTSLEYARDIAKIPSAGGEMTFVLNERYDERYPVFHPKTGELLYTSDETGIFNIYSQNLETGEKKAFTNAVGGAFMPSFTPNGDLFYSLYTNQGYKIYRIAAAKPVASETMAYIDNYEKHIPQLTLDQSIDNPLPAKPYKSRFPGVSLMPRVSIDYGTFKPGLYVYTNEMLNKMLVFGGFDFNFRGDYDIFSIFEYNLFKPTFFIEAYNHSSNIKDDLTLSQFPGVSPEVDINFNLFQANIGLRGQFLPWKFKYLWTRLEYILSWYRARQGEVAFNEPINNEPIIFAPVRYTYLKGHALSLFFRHEQIKRDLERDINPRKGRYVSLKITREWNKFLDDFATDRIIGIEQFTNYNFFRYELNWEEYFPVPLTNRHTFSLRFQGGYIDKDVDDFFHLFGGGFVGLKGYSYYSVEGRKLAIGTATYRLPLLRNINWQFLNFYFDRLYLAGIAQYGNAWVDGGVDFNDFLSDVGVQLRLDMKSWYFFPTKVFFEAVYPLEEQINREFTYNKEWRFYFGILFDFDLRLEKQRFRF